MSKQVKSKKRVADHGEVFTAEREVNAMLDLVKPETIRIESRFLEPACGDGNFLAEILHRKLASVKRKYRKSPSDFEKFAVLAASTIYGVELLPDNVKACRKRLFDMWDKEYQAVCKKEVNEDCQKSVRFILGRNILCGNALSLKQVDENSKDTDIPIIFSEWGLVGLKMHRQDWTLDRLMSGLEKGRDIFGDGKPSHKIPVQGSLLNELQKEKGDDEGELIKDFPLIYYRRVWEYGE